MKQDSFSDTSRGTFHSKATNIFSNESARLFSQIVDQEKAE